MFVFNPLDRRPRSIDGFPRVQGAFPFLGHVPGLATDTLELVRRSERLLGPLFYIEAGFGRRMLICSHPDSLSVFQTKLGSSGYMRDAGGGLFGESVIVQDGKVHQRMRAVLNGPFTPRGLSAAEIGPMIAAIVEERAKRFASGETLKVLAETRELALEVVFRIVGIEDDLTEWRERYEDALLALVNLPIDAPGFPRRRGRTGKAWINARLHEKIRAARARPGEGSGMLAALVSAKGEAGETLSDDELVDNLRLLMLAGHETSASTMAWIVSYLAQHGAVWDRLVAEVRALGHIPKTAAGLRQLPFAEAVFREALRLHPPVAIDARRLTGPLELCGRIIPTGTQLTIPVIHLSRHADLHVRPDAFEPERWMGRAQAITPLELIQFGGGPHFCLGYHLAWMEIVQFTAAIALALSERGKRPVLASAPPAPRYMPLLHPSGNLRMRAA